MIAARVLGRLLEENDEYRAYVEAVDLIGILQAKVRVAIRKGDRA